MRCLMPRDETPPPLTPGGYRVTLHVFSGRVDPAWVLSLAQVAALVTRIDALPLLPPLPPGTSHVGRGLGYGGFTVDGLVEGTVGDLAVSPITAFKGLIWQGSGTGAMGRADPKRTVEWWLLKTGASSLAPAMIHFVTAHLGGERSARTPPPEAEDIDPRR
jgi:hypothetical protein